MGDYRKLEVWQEARGLAAITYRISERFPAREQFGITNQVRRCAVSIMANIAEGCGRNRDRELGRYLSIALGSASELESHLILALDLGFLGEADSTELFPRVDRIRRMLAALSHRIKANS